MTNSNQRPPRPYDDEIDLAELFCILWAGKWLIGGITFVAAVLAVIYALMLPNVYRAEALLAPSDNKGAGSISALAAQYGGLASLAGINLPAGAPDKTILGLEVLKSRKFISEFIDRHDILVPLMAAKNWDEGSGELEIDSDVYNVSAKKWIRKVSSSRQAKPSIQEAYGSFIKVLSVSQDRESGLVRIAIEHYSPSIAKKWVDWLVEDINFTIMQRDVAEAEQAIAYLNEQVESTSLADLQNVFFKLVEEQTKTVMLAKVSDEYLLKTLDPAIAPEKRSKPKRSLTVMLAVIVGVVFGVFAQYLRHSITTNRKNDC